MERPATCCELCRTLSARRGTCLRAARRAAGRALAQGQRSHVRLRNGGCLLAMPIYRRRRIVGVAVACYPAREMLDEEFLARTCDRLGLDRQAVAAMAEHDCRYSAEEAEGLLDLLEWLLEREQDQAVAKEELANLSANLAVTYEELSLLYSISGSMSVTQDPPDFLHSVCEELLEVMNISGAAAIEYAHPSSGERETLVVAGEIDLDVPSLRKLMLKTIASSLTGDDRAILCNDFADADDPELTRRIDNYIAVPLVSDDNRIGLLVGTNKVVGEFDSVDLKLLNSIGNQSSVFLANNRLYADLQDLLMGVLHALTATIDAKDPYTCGHSHRVALISKRIAEDMGLPAEKVRQIYLCGLLHDIGKIGVPEAVLTKPGRLTDDEYDKIRLHPSIGARILGGIRQLDEVIVGILTHHERPDGSGYPQGLSGDALPLDGLIVGLADSFDAMTSDRTYRKALPLEQVIREIRDHAGTQFDPRVVETFLAMDVDALMEEMRQSVTDVMPVEPA